MKKSLLCLVLLGAAAACESASAPDPSTESTLEDATVAPGGAMLSRESLPMHRVEVISSGEGLQLGWCDEPAGVVRLAAPGTGNLTHGGRFELQQTNCVNLASGAITEGQGTLTTANGDEIHLVYGGQVLPVVPQTLELSYVVVGGTGRFESAAGEVDVVVVYTSPTTWVSEGAGWLQYAASDAASP